MEACHLLKEYMLFTTKIREKRARMALRDAINEAVDECIREGILAEFLKTQRAEVVAVSIFEYDQEKHIRLEREESYEEGLERGLAEGRNAGLIEGQDRMLMLLHHMRENKELHLVDKLQDKMFLEQMYEKYGL